ncbi:MAG: hypothetical protein JSV03_15490 [Planctomycetota bacterium]|nr:MAG: hypothetical protein JSV03_15490 [Planctomycetota bacterium]
MKKCLLQYPILLAVLVPGLIFMFFSQSVRAAEDHIRLGKNVAQLFIDDYLIEASAGLRRTMHRPKKDHDGQIPVIAPKPDTTLLAYGTIVKDPLLKQYVMFVQEFPSRKMYRYVSTDGLSWQPRNGDDFETVEFDLDLEPQGGAIGRQGIDVFSCYFDSSDKTYPYQGWLYFANYGHDREGIYFVRSKDGKKWERGRQVVNAWAGPGDTSSRKIHQDGKTVYGPGDVTLFSYDPVDKRLLGLFKFFTNENVGPGNNLRSRAYAFLESLDKPFDANRIKHISLLPPADYTTGDTPFDEYYASTAWRYGSLWLGGLKVWHNHGNYPHSAAGCAFLKLVSSRDGLKWKKVPYLNDAGVPEVFISNGPEGGNNGANDGGYLSEFSQGPFHIGNELIYYYSASSYGKNYPHGKRITGGGIFRARLRIDGFVSVDGGTLITHPLSFDGSDLLVNGIGPVTVEVLDNSGKSVARQTLSGDSLKHHVRFDGKSLREVMASSPIRLGFNVEDGGRLFSFAIH